MAYIIENAHILKGKQIQDLSLLIKEDRIASARGSFKMYKHLRMDASEFIMTPTHVLLDLHLPLHESFEQRKAYYVENFIKRGVTTVLTCVTVQRERQLEKELKKLHTALLDSPFDYVVGVCVPSTLLNPGFIRKCKKEKIPAIFVNITNESEIQRVPWGWIKEAMFPYNCPIIPVFKTVDKRVKKTWGHYVESVHLPSFKDTLPMSQPLERNVLEKIGIYPRKSYLHDGGEVSYNFYLKDSETVKMIESELFLKQHSKLVITVHKGKVIRAGKQICYRPGFGEHVQINTPAFYQSPR